MNEKKNLCMGFYCSTMEKQINVFAKVDRGIMLMNWTLNLHEKVLSLSTDYSLAK